jgi:hypothetical protein
MTHPIPHHISLRPPPCPPPFPHSSPPRAASTAAAIINIPLFAPRIRALVRALCVCPPSPPSPPPFLAGRRGTLVSEGENFIRTARLIEAQKSVDRSFCFLGYLRPKSRSCSPLALSAELRRRGSSLRARPARSAPERWH